MGKRVGLDPSILTGVFSFAGTFIGADNFDDNAKNTSLWGTDVASGNGSLVEINERVEFIASGTGVNDSSRPWIANFGSYNEGWQIRLDVANSHIAVNDEVSSCGFEVFHRENPLNSVFVEIYSVSHENGKGFNSALQSEGE